MSHRSCINDPDHFCYICGKYTLPKQRRNITDVVKKSYLAYFGIKLGDQSKPWAPHKICRACIEGLRHWVNGKRPSLPFGIPMVWRELSNHSNDCYFCSCNVKGYNSKNKNQIVYPVVRSAILPVPHRPDVPIPVRPENLEQFSSESDVEVMEIETSDSDYLPGSSAAERGCFNQSELNDLVRDLALSKELAELLGSILQEKI